MKFVERFQVLLLILVLSGCASTHNPRDPLEGFNRAMFSFNDAVDRGALKPAAEVYEAVLPSFVKAAVGNFFGNLGDVWTAVNNFLQGNIADGVTDVIRVAFNSTFGLGGLINIASEAGMPKHKEDFGQTLGKWGVGAGPYIVLPLFGSSTLRDSVALPVDFKGDLWRYKNPTNWRNVGSVVRLVDRRAAVLGASNLLDEAALDRYEFVRDAFLQRRENKLNEENNMPKGAMSDVGPDVQAKTEEKASPGFCTTSLAPELAYEQMMQSVMLPILQPAEMRDVQFGKEELALSLGEDEEGGELDDLL